MKPTSFMKCGFFRALCGILFFSLALLITLYPILPAR